MTPPNVSAPFGKSAIFSHHFVNFAVFLYHSVTSVTILYQVAAFFQFDVQCGGGKVLSDWLSSSTRASKPSIFEMQ